MTISLNQYTPNTPCGICLEHIERGHQGVIHSGDNGKKHPFHKECLDSWIEHSPTRPARCPACQIPLGSTIERVKSVARHIAAAAIVMGSYVVCSRYEKELASMPPSLPGMPIFINMGNEVFYELPVVPFLAMAGIIGVLGPIILKLTSPRN